MESLLYTLIPLLPLAAFLILGLFGHWIKDRADLVAVPAVLTSFLFSLLVFDEVAGGKNVTIPLYTWLTSGDLRIELSLYFDRLTAVMLLLVTIVSGLVHVYTIGYMHGERGYARFFAYIALFTFAMLMLVMADNFLQLFVFWEAVGLCSYLLIGHWYERATARAAATKAFIVNRVGDFGFLLGVLLVWLTFGSLEYRHVFAQAADLTGETVNLLSPIGGTWEVSTLTMICLLLFLGAVGKSAQVPLHVWLPDSMEGPTPISALIHAATMVTAGIFMVARMSPLFELSEAALQMIAGKGEVSCSGVCEHLRLTPATVSHHVKELLGADLVHQRRDGRMPAAAAVAVEAVELRVRLAGARLQRLGDAVAVARGAVDGHGGRIGILVNGKHRRNHLDVITEILGEERADRPVDQAAVENRLLAGTSLAADEPARNLAGRVQFLLVVAGEREEVDPLPRRRRHHGRYEQHGVTHPHGDRA